MSSNPFTINAALNAPMLTEMFQRIHVNALHGAVRGLYPGAVPGHIDVEQLKRDVDRAGSDSYLLHPADVDRIFAGVTPGVFQTVEKLYCSRLVRSIPMVWQLVNAMARQGGGTEVTYEAVWEICLYLEERRRMHVDINIERGNATWCIGEIVPDFRLRGRETEEHCPSIIMVIDTDTQRVLSFRIATERTRLEAIALALYDALISQRRPHQLSIAGLLWRIPRRITAEIVLPQECYDTCRAMGIPVEAATGTFTILQALRDTWAQGLAGRVLPQSHCALLLDTYLSKMYGYGPIRGREQQDHEFAGAAGYNRDPAWQFPLLRHLLPRSVGAITQDGLIPCNGRYYSDDLLIYWPGHAVTLRLSAYSESTAWVYLDGEILCQAMAGELRRYDRSNQTHQAER